MADSGGLHATPSGTRHRRRPALAVGAVAACGISDPDAGVAEFRYTLAPGGHAGRSAETPRALSRTAQGAALWSGQTLPSRQESRLEREYSTDWRILAASQEGRSPFTKNAS